MKLRRERAMLVQLEHPPNEDIEREFYSSSDRLVYWTRLLDTYSVRKNTNKKTLKTRNTRLETHYSKYMDMPTAATLRRLAPR